MHALRAIADRLIGLSAFVGALALVGLVGVIVVDVVGRAFGNPIFGSQDMITMGMSILVFGGMALCDRRGGHIAVDLLEARFSNRMNLVIDIGAALLGAAAFLLIAWTIWESSLISQMLNLSTNLLSLPKAWFQWAVCGFSVLTALGLILRAVELAVFRRDVRQQRHGGP